MTNSLWMLLSNMNSYFCCFSLLLLTLILSLEIFENTECPKFDIFRYILVIIGYTAMGFATYWFNFSSQIHKQTRTLTFVFCFPVSSENSTDLICAVILFLPEYGKRLPWIYVMSLPENLIVYLEIHHQPWFSS